jgi:DNA (cytosine-5)-methyltransferase 1
MKQKFSLITLFSGVSGSSLGFHNTGRVEERLAIDYDDYVEKSFKLNFPDVPFLNRPLGPDLPGKEILEMVQLSKGELAILFASPPCQGWSTAKGKRSTNDGRNDLFLDTIKYIDELQPLTFVIENVAGLIKGKMVHRFNHILRLIEKAGYIYAYKILHAVEYGVPQLRDRVFIIGVRNDLGIPPIFPIPQKFDHTKFAIKNYVDDIDFFSSGQFANDIFTKDDICRTITATASLTFYKRGEERKPRIKEIKRLCSFPEDYRLWSKQEGINPQNGLEYSYNNKYKAIGNSVPPKLMEAVANTVLSEILDQ